MAIVAKTLTAIVIASNFTESDHMQYTMCIIMKQQRGPRIQRKTENMISKYKVYQKSNDNNVKKKN